MASVVNSNSKRVRKSGTVSNNKKKVNTPDGMKLRKKTSFRQMSLKESFSNQETISKRLRPRKVSRNYCEDSVLQQNNKKRENESIKGEKSKIPVYKSVKLKEESLRSGSDVYDFKFDANDSKERLVTKRRGHLINRMRQKRVKKTTRAKLKLVPPTVEEKVSSDKPSVNIEKKVKNNKKPVSQSSNNVGKKSKDNIKEDVLVSSANTVKKLENDTEKEHALLLPTVINNIESESNNECLLTDNRDKETQSSNMDNLGTNNQASTKVTFENTEKQQNTIVKPKIVSIETFDKDKILIETPLKSNLEHHVPFRKTNIFKNKVSLQYGNMMNHSLINKSLSPITKASEHFDPGSPWRLSPLNTFSQVRNLFQSTPQPRPIEILQGRIKRNMKDQVTSFSETVKKSNILETDNENINVHKTDKSNSITRKLGQSIRKFGTEITNLDHSVQSINNTTITEQYEGMTSNKELKPLDIDTQNTINSIPNVSSSYNESAEDKENAVPKSIKYKKKIKKGKRLKKINNTSSSLLKENSMQYKETQNTLSRSLNIQVSSPGLSNVEPENVEQSREIFDPQPGPSGLQKNKSPNSKPLQQTSLNAFLNIAEMPQSTRINTPHGIFDDAHSTPIHGKPLKLMKQADTEKMELDNAFGFIEDSSDSNLDISPIYSDSRNNDVESKKIEKINVPQARKISALPIRLLPQTITKNIVQENVNTIKNDAKNVDTVDIEEKQTMTIASEKPTNRVNFSDTFDVLEENNETKDESSVIPLFTDCEPVHFTQPPKRSYKRKRNIRFNFSGSGSEDNEEMDDSELEQRKKKKYGKLKKSEVQRMQQWIKSINSTFQEIDQYELHVE